MEILLRVFLLSWLITTWSCPVERAGVDKVLDQVLRCISTPPERIDAAKLLVQDLRRVVQERWPGSKVLQFGALEADMGTRSSDVDCFVQLPEGSLPTYTTVSEARDLLATHPHLFHDLNIIPNATVPLVKFTHAPTGYHCDVNFRSPAGVVQTQLLKYLLHLDDRARQLAVVVKQWAREHKPVNARRVMPNYAMALMVVFYLQQRRILPTVALLQQHADTVILDHWQMGYRPIPYASTDDATLFHLLSGFFQFYAHFDFENKIISPFNGTAIDRSLFESLDTVPEIYDNYKRNVGLNLTKPLRIDTAVCVQNVFQHSENVAKATTRELLDYFRLNLKFAAEHIKDVQNHSLVDIFDHNECYSYNYFGSTNKL